MHTLRLVSISLAYNALTGVPHLFVANRKFRYNSTDSGLTTQRFLLYLNKSISFVTSTQIKIPSNPNPSIQNYPLSYKSPTTATTPETQTATYLLHPNEVIMVSYQPATWTNSTVARNTNDTVLI